MEHNFIQALNHGYLVRGTLSNWGAVWGHGTPLCLKHNTGGVGFFGCPLQVMVHLVHMKQDLPNS